MLVLAIVAFGVPLALSLGDRADDEIRARTRSQADLIAVSAGDLVVPPRRTVLRDLARTGARFVGGRVLIVDTTGRVLADSTGTTTGDRGYHRRPEIAAALAGRHVQDRRTSRTLDRELLVTAVPVVAGGRRVGAVRISQSVDAVDRAVRRNVGGLALIAAIVLAAGLLVAFVLARQIAGPLHRLREAAGRVAAGDLQARAPEEGTTEQRDLARSFNTMTERVARALRSQQSFVADASHQLRTPLTGLRLRLEEATAAGVPPAAERELAAARVELDRLSQTIDELLVLSRSGEHDAPGEATVPAAAARRAVQRWERTASEHDVTLRATGDGRDAVWCARADLDRALDALIENAVLYAAGSGEVEVRTSGTTIEVLDRGPGLGDEDGEAVFRRFHRGTAGRQGPSGTGLGLPIARELMRRWDGDATLRARPGGGAVAALTLPPFTGPLPDGA